MEENQESDEGEMRYVTRAAQLAIRRLFEHLPGPFEEKYAALLELRHCFHDEMAAAFEPALREQLEIQPQGTREKRADLCLACIERLERLGLSMVSPRTEDLVHLTLDDDKDLLHLSGPPTGRYVLVHVDHADRRIVTDAYHQLPPVHLAEASADGVRDQPSFRWAEESNPGPRGKGR